MKVGRLEIVYDIRQDNEKDKTCLIVLERLPRGKKILNHIYGTEAYEIYKRLCKEEEDIE